MYLFEAMKAVKSNDFIYFLLVRNMIKNNIIFSKMSLIQEMDDI